MGYRGGYRRGYRRSGSRRNYGAERAAQHIAEAAELSRQLGGTDEDVKQYFFSLQKHDLDKVLEQYTLAYGSSAGEYAQLTMSDWRSGRRRMSGMVASRLYALLPPLMPLQKKYELVGNLWKHFGPRSETHFTIGPDATTDAIIELANPILKEAVTSYQVPDNLKNRFNWLTCGDVAVYQQMLNHFLSLEKDIVTLELRPRADLFLSQIRSKGSTSTAVNQTIQINNHKIILHFDTKATGVSEGSPNHNIATGNELIGWIFWLGIGGIALYMFFGSS